MTLSHHTSRKRPHRVLGQIGDSRGWPVPEDSDLYSSAEGQPEISVRRIHAVVCTLTLTMGLAPSRLSTYLNNS